MGLVLKFFQRPCLYIFTGPIDKFVANVLEIDPLVHFAAFHTEISFVKEQSLRAQGTLKWIFFSLKYSTYISYVYYNFSIL